MTPFAEGQEAASRYGYTWFDCPYVGTDMISSYKRRMWLNGFDSRRKVMIRYN